MAQGVNVRELTMGPLSAQVRRRATPRQWRKIVHKAQKRGVTVESMLDQTIPAALKQRTRSSLRKEATNTISSVYAPAERELTQRESRIRAVDEKRARDNQYYLDWLKSRSDSMAGASRQADTVLRDTQRQIVQDAQAQSMALRNEMMQAAAAQPGNVSDPTQATAFDTSASTERNNALLAGEREATNRTIGANESRQATLEASNFALIAASEAKRSADTWTSLADLGDEKQRVQLSKAADAAKEVARLLDQEGAKAESNREFKAVAQRLGLDMASIQQRERDSRRDARTQAQQLAETRRSNRAKLRLERRKQNFKEGLDSAKLQLDQDQLDFDRLKHDQKLDLDWYKAKHSGKGGKGASSTNPQDRFEYGYALVATSVYQGKPRKDGTYPNKRYDYKWVARNYDLVVNQLVNKGKFKRGMAKSIVDAFIRHGGSDPGDYQQYQPRGPFPTNAK